MSILSSIVVGSVFAYMIMFVVYLMSEKAKGLKNSSFILSFLAWLFSIVSFYQAGILADQHGTIGQFTFGEAFLSLMSLVLIGKALFYPKNHKPKGEQQPLKVATAHNE
ncbi:MAG TPA: hypothetical protein VIG73_09215 [Cerasibacillus sp.]|uniref:hypothetical protein n=1 Tax=Cerasibacillus sp. TaxID=2498711 RepID=UPI002F403B90